jgi:hypothetical protein
MFFFLMQSCDLQDDLQVCLDVCRNRHHRICCPYTFPFYFSRTPYLVSIFIDKTMENRTEQNPYIKS